MVPEHCPEHQNREASPERASAEHSRSLYRRYATAMHPNISEENMEWLIDHILEPEYGAGSEFGSDEAGDARLRTTLEGEIQMIEALRSLGSGAITVKQFKEIMKTIEDELNEDAGETA